MPCKPIIESSKHVHAPRLNRVKIMAKPQHQTRTDGSTLIPNLHALTTYMHVMQNNH
uniref:Uncharacterized protein n=1 Tax=Arundo donax TaxID=35708 RepID=A0A0A9F1T9_ARUDO